MTQDYITFSESGYLCQRIAMHTIFSAIGRHFGLANPERVS
jgi:hypothetical protein